MKMKPAMQHQLNRRLKSRNKDSRSPSINCST